DFAIAGRTSLLTLFLRFHCWERSGCWERVIIKDVVIVEK
ncbi:85_t:CDS:1, partial [Racocetra persica]